MIVYFGILTTDIRGGTGYWRSNTAFFLKFTSGSFLQTNSYRLSGGTRVNDADYCYRNGKNEQWNKITQSYSYGTPNVSLNFDIYNNETNTSALWGMK